MSASVAADLIHRLLCDADLAALVSTQTLSPLAGDTVYPASYAAPDGGTRDDKGPRYCITELRDGNNICVIDSIPSQANRIETALLGENYKGLIPDVRIQAELADGSVGEKHMLELGHRATDGAVLATDLEQTITDALRSIRSAPEKLAKLAPMCLLMGVWDSRKNRTGLKLPRAFSATIEATNVSLRRRHAQYNSAWHANDLASALQDAAGTVKPSEIGLDGVPSGDGLGGVVVHGEIKRVAFLATNPLRANCSSTHPGAKRTAEYIAALGLVALTMPSPPWLRTGCNLIAKGKAMIDVVNVDGTRVSIEINHDEAVSAARQCADKLGISALNSVVGTMRPDRIARLASAKDGTPAKAKSKGTKTGEAPSGSAEGE